MRTIGLIGGMGWESSATYYRVMNTAVRACLGGLSSARIVLDSLEFGAIASAQQRADHDFVRGQLIESARRLECAGAELLVIACNTVHRFAKAVESQCALPLLHIADPAGTALRVAGHTRVGLMGTRATLEGSFLRRRLSTVHGLDIVVPPVKTIDRLHALILNELAAGRRTTDTTRQLDSWVQEFVDAGCSAVLLACTELGLAWASADAPLISRALPCFDTAVLHARAAVDIALAVE